MQQENGVIVAAPRKFVGRESGKFLVQLIGGSRLFRAAAALLLPFIGVVAAFGIAPDTVTEPAAQTPVVLELALPRSASAGSVPAEGYWREERIQRGDTLPALLARLGAEDPEALQHLRSTRAARALYQLVPGRIDARAGHRGGAAARAALPQRRQRAHRGAPTATAFSVVEQPAELERRVLMKSAEIRSSLFAASDAAGLSDCDRDAARGYLLHRHRFSPRPAPRRSFLGGLRDVL